MQVLVYQHGKYQHSQQFNRTHFDTILSFMKWFCLYSGALLVQIFGGCNPRVFQQKPNDNHSQHAKHAIKNPFFSKSILN